MGGDLRVRTAEKEVVNGFNVVYESKIAWGDMDAFGHANNTVFFRLFESARMAYLDRIGFNGEDGGLGPILASTQCRFRRPLVYRDQVRVGARVTEVGEDRFTMEYLIVNQRGQAAADGGGIIVSFDYQKGVKVPVPDAVREAIRAIDGV
jgi:acyl-CoA thioester hydrolase